MNKDFVVTIDGPSGAGKGTLSQLLARELGATLLDSGALYRLVALSSLDKSIAVDSVDELAVCARDLDVQFSSSASGVRILLEGRDVTTAIRDERVSMQASAIAALEPVRAALLQRQRDFAGHGPLVADGRDMGTTVFPRADFKFYLTASAEARAQRRYAQLVAAGETVDMARLVADIEARDERDQSRASSPLRPAPDARIIDSTELNIEEVLQQMLLHVSVPGGAC
ncbi:(d)CMP kinase [Gilvimarinus algae]|uniref:Cytidylate kinase n=1 Tax=Gilvimarinus algae TaxID=3058037 RepID=A0ABT8TGA5_9GAMM|nr:(d)CMP kinase [Gilvimarinus sp. SDUM040014]MDO3382554.1 (d)CMP kinase [Gilvimarinus sp. SDUM040014]